MVCDRGVGFGESRLDGTGEGDEEVDGRPPVAYNVVGTKQQNKTKSMKMKTNGTSMQENKMRGVES